MNMKNAIRFFCIATLIAAAQSRAVASELGDTATAVQPGAFAEMNVSGFNNNLLFWEGRHAFAYTDTLKWDPNARKVHFTGAGHLVTTKHLVYTESTNSWQTLTAGGSHVAHGYDHAAIDPAGRKYYFRGFNRNHLEIYDLDSRNWTQSSSFPSNYQVAGGVAWFPELGRVIVFDERAGIVAYNPGNNLWSTLATNVVAGNYHNFAEYSPVHRVVIAGGGNDFKSIYRVDASGSVTKMKDAPFNLGITASVVTVDPVSGNFIVVRPNGSFYEYNPMSDVWTNIGVSVPSKLLTNSGDSGGWGLLATPVSTHGVILFAKYDGDSSSMFVYKHSESSGNPVDPTPLVDLSSNSATVVSGGDVTLNWSVSNASSCTASNDWSGSKNTGGGSETISGLTADSTFVLTCNSSGGSDSMSVNVTVTSAGGNPPPTSDWVDRSTAPGVLMATRFDTDAEVSNWKTSSKQENIVWDTSLKASGAGSMKMNILNTDTTASGNWRRYLSDDQRGFGPGDEFYVQFRQYIPAYLIEHKFKGAQYSGIYSQGFKSSIISHFRNSNTNFEVVVQNSGQFGYIQGYHQDGESTAIKWDKGVSSGCQNSDFRHQPAIDHGPQNVGTACENDRARYGGLYSYFSSQGGDRGNPDPLTGAFVYEKDAWITILQHIRVSPSGYGASDNVVETWAARDGEDYVLLASLNNIKFGTSGQFDTLWLLNYRSKGQADSSRQNTFTNYDEVIVSTDFIPAPGKAADATPAPRPNPVSGLTAD